jgi:hypothetical protein
MQPERTSSATLRAVHGIPKRLMDTDDEDYKSRDDEYGHYHEHDYDDDENDEFDDPADLDLDAPFSDNLHELEKWVHPSYELKSIDPRGCLVTKTTYHLMM